MAESVNPKGLPTNPVWVQDELPFDPPLPPNTAQPAHEDEDEDK